MDQKTGIRSLYDDFFRCYGAKIRLSWPAFRPNSTHKPTCTPSSRRKMAIFDVKEVTIIELVSSRVGGDNAPLGGRAMGRARFSIAGLMILVGLIAIDCAILVRGFGFIGDSLVGAGALFCGVLPMINVVGVELLLILQPPARR
jgi:hypothetical protein